MIRKIKNNQGFTLIELMIVIAIIGILAAIAIPNFIAYRNKSFCSRAETDVNSIAAATADYFSIASHVATPTFAELGITLSGTAPTNNTGGLTGVDPNNNITITVADRSSRCPLDYRTSSPGWDTNANFGTYTKTLRIN